MSGAIWIITCSLVKDNPSSSAARAVDHFRYEVQLVGGFEIGMHADHIFADQGPHHISDGEVVWLLLIHPDVALVLIDAPTNRGIFPTFRRIGIVKQPSALVNEYLDIDWFKGYEKKTNRIL